MLKRHMLYLLSYRPLCCSNGTCFQCSKGRRRAVLKFSPQIAELFLVSAENQRAERRIKSKGRFALSVAGGDSVLANVCDISISGMCLEAEKGIEPGSAVRLDGDGIIADGVVRYCRFENGLYWIGVALQPPD